MRIVFALFVALALAGCASSRGFDRGSLHSQVSEQKQVTEEDIKKALELKPQLPSPFRLAIYLAPPPPPKSWPYVNRWNWHGEDKDKMVNAANELKANGHVSDVFVISEYLAEGSDNKAIRLAAARAGADAVLIVNGACDVDRYNNALGYSYILLVTAFVVPGTEADALFLANASLWDVRNQYLYLSTEAEGIAKETKPAVFIEETRVVKQAKSAALTNLQGELLSRLAKIAAK